MTGFDELNRKNGGRLMTTRDAAFAPYGRVLPSESCERLLTVTKATAIPETSNLYVPSLPELEREPQAAELAREVFGGGEVQFGYCNGHTHALGALEWHECPEINCAAEPLVLMLALREDVHDWRVASSTVKLFYLPEGTAVVLYPGTLHFAPCAVSDMGFRCMVGLGRGTNLSLADRQAGEPLRAVNKWLLCHAERTDLLAAGGCEGIDGENISLVY